MRFSKYHGTGNDFVMIEDVAGKVELTPDLVALLCDRHKGIGADGLIRIASSDEADFFMDYWNADGATAEMCGNGIRCLAKYVYDRGLTDKTELAVDTRDGVKQLWLDVDDGAMRSVRVDMGVPSLERGTIPMRGSADDTFVGMPFPDAGPEYTAAAVSMGNPHLVLVGSQDLRELDLRRIGPPLEHHPDFPERTNVEFISLRNRTHIDVRVWERGVGETMACGTGACASLVAAAEMGLADRRAKIVFPGGPLELEWADDGHVYLTGPATFVFDGEHAPDWAFSVKTEFGAAR